MMVLVNFRPLIESGQNEFQSDKNDIDVTIFIRVSNSNARLASLGVKK